MKNKSLIRNIGIIIIGLIIVFLISRCFAPSNSAQPNLNTVVSVSSNGNYAIATNTNKQAVLWNLKDHTYKILFRDANIYSAYFIKNTDDFMYQNDKTNEVIVENVDRKVIKKFNPGFPTYGEAITNDLRTYAAADENLSVYKIDLSNNQKYVLNQSWCVQDHNGEDYTGPGTSDCLNFMSSDQTFGLQFTPDQTKLIGGNFFALFIWDLTTNTGKMIQKNNAQTIAAISPDGSYVVTGDTMNRAVKVELPSASSTNYQGFFYNIPLSEIQQQLYGEGSSEIFAIKFIDTSHLLVFRHMLPYQFNYAALYDLTQIKPIGHPEWIFHYAVDPTSYLPLINSPDNNINSEQNSWPLISDEYSRDQAIDTSPSTHILVMSQQSANGIIVYQYDPATQTLTKTWTGNVSWWDNHF